jgi:hypothetical protein
MMIVLCGKAAVYWRLRARAKGTRSLCAAAERSLYSGLNDTGRIGDAVSGPIACGHRCFGLLGSMTGL